MQSFYVFRPAARLQLSARPAPRLVRADASLQFVKGIVEDCIPDVKLTRSRDGSSGTATFVFESPSVFEVRFCCAQSSSPAFCRFFSVRASPIVFRISRRHRRTSATSRDCTWTTRRGPFRRWRCRPSS